jgi:hypothetical protein
VPRKGRETRPIYLVIGVLAIAMLFVVSEGGGDFLAVLVGIGVGIGVVAILERHQRRYRDAKFRREQ